MKIKNTLKSVKNYVLSSALSFSLIFSPIALQAGGWEAFQKGFNNSQMGQFGKNFDKDTKETVNNIRGFKNVTHGDKTDNGKSDGGGTLYGGTYEFRFKNSATAFKPWVDFEVPGVKASCNGFSLNGGFADFLGFDGIAEQLGNASGALMWGLLVGLINSLPSLEQVFARIKEEIGKLQALLKNACNFGAQMSQNMMKGAKKDMQAWADKATDYVNKGADYFASQTLDRLSGIKEDPLGANKEKASKEFSEKINTYLFIRGNAELLANELLLDDARFKMRDKMVSEEERGFIPLIEATVTPYNEGALLYLFAVNLLGEDVINPQLYQFYLEIGNVLPKLIAKGQIKNANEVEKKALKKISKDSAEVREGASGSSITMEELIKNNPLPAPIGAANMINQILKGGEGGKIELYPANVLYMQARGKDNIIYNLLVTKDFEEKPIKIAWEGLEKESKKAIECILEKGIEYCNTTDHNKVNFIIPGGGEIIKFLSTLRAKIKNPSTTDSKILISQRSYHFYLNVASKINAYIYASYFLNNIADKKRKASIQKAGQHENNKDEDEEKIQKYISLLVSEIQNLEKTYGTNMDIFQKALDRLKATRVTK